jgi:hypothetical protein
MIVNYQYFQSQYLIYYMTILNMYGIFHQFLKINQINYILFLHLKFPYKMIHK